MDNHATFLLTLGGILLLGLVTSQLGRRTFLPRVTLLIIFGAIIGPEVLDIVPPVFSDRFELAANLALLMVGFLLGGKLTRDTLGQSAGHILWISISAALAAMIVVAIVLSVFGVPLEVAIILGCIASATDAAAVFDVVLENKHKGRFQNLLLAIVGLDDAWALLLFAFGMAVVTSLNGGGLEWHAVLVAVREIGGAIILGLVIGLPAAYLTGRAKPGQPLLTEALGLIFVCGGLALWLDVSFLIAAMVMGATVANLAKHHEFYFHEIEGVEWPFMVVFFVLAGAILQIDSIVSIGLVGVVYILSRALGKFVGALVGGWCSGADSATRKWIGPALLPQAGVAIGMALVATSEFPEFRQIVLPLVISSTVVFEIVGPVITRYSVKRAN